MRSGQLSNVPAPPPKTNQVTSYYAGDDGALQSGVAWPSPRFSDNGNGSVTDNLTDLVWLKNANCFGPQSWTSALAESNALASSACGLTDGSDPGDWQLPNINELLSLFDLQHSTPPLPADHLFSNFQPNAYWSGSVTSDNKVNAWAFLPSGIYSVSKNNASSVLPVRSEKYSVLGSLKISGAAKNFGNVALGSNTAISQLRLKNLGATAVSVLSLNLTGADSSQFTVVTGGNDPCTSLSPTLTPGTFCTMLVIASPTSIGPKSANLTITTTDGSKDYSLTATAYSTLFGDAFDMSTGLPVSGATVRLNTSESMTTDSTGSFNFGTSFSFGTYSLEVTKSGYQSQSASNLIVSNTQSGISNILLPTFGLFNITSTLLLSATSGEAYSSRVMVTGGTAPYTFVKVYGNLPGGLALDAATGAITGTPIGTGNYTFAIGVTDSASAYSEMEYTIDLVPTMQITTASLPRGIQSTGYNSAIIASGGKPPYTYSITTGTLPSGLTLNSVSGSITGIASSAGTYNVTFAVTDSTGRKTSKSLTIKVDPSLLITNLQIPTTLANTPYSATISATGGYGPYVWSITGDTLPIGMTFDTATGSISGQTANTGSFPIDITVMDAFDRTVTKSFTLKVATPLAISTSLLPAGYLSTPYLQYIPITGGITPFSFTYTGILPAGLFFNSSTGRISGTPATAGFTNLSITVSDSAYPTPATATKTVSIRIWNALVISTTTIPEGTQKTAYSVALSGSGGAAPLSWSIATGTLPQGISFDSTSGAISGTPIACGAFPFSARLTDSASPPKSVDKNLLLTITCSNDYIISGNAGIEGAIVTYNGTESGTVIADGSGNYSIGPLLNGAYTVSPSKSSYNFVPASRNVTINSLDISVAAFVAELQSFNLNVTILGDGTGTVNGTINSNSISPCNSGTCNYSATAASTVNLFASASYPSSFEGWSNGCSGTDICTINSLSANTVVNALFAKINKIKLSGTLALHASLQDAYTAANDGETFLLQVFSFTENLYFNFSKNIILRGGYDSNYNSSAGVTTIQGSLTIEQGSVDISDVVIQ